MHAEIIVGDAMDVLKTMPDQSVHCCVTSPPYWGLRDYGVAGQLGLERTPQEYVARMVEVFREVRRVLRDDGTLWLNLGDSYAADRGGTHQPAETLAGGRHGKTAAGERVNRGRADSYSPTRNARAIGLKHKNLIGIPWRVAFALQADGWYLRSDIIWCLSGGTWLYVWTKDSGECLMTVKDLFRIKDRSPMLWTGEHWSSLLGMSKSPRLGIELEIVLRSGERISCTPTHQFPVHGRGVIKAMDIRIGDSLTRCKLPEPYPVEDGAIDEDAAWLAGLYVAEGSRSGDTIQIAGNAKEEGRWKACHRISKTFGGTATRTVSGNRMDIRIYGRVINAMIDELVCGRTAHDKGFSPAVWRHSNRFIDAMLRGYLNGDGHWEPANKRFRLGFCRNYNLERDLRTACARLGYHLVLKLSTVAYQGRRVPAFRGELRMERSGHKNEKNSAEVIAIRKARCRDLYDIGVAHEPHLFALASGILTHNSKPNPMPESVTDRPTKAHEYLFLLSKRERYFYDAEAIKEPADDKKTFAEIQRQLKRRPGNEFRKGDYVNDTCGTWTGDGEFSGGRNKRTVWTVPTAPYPEAHFATYPPDLIKPCILAGCPVGGTVLDPFGGSGTTGMVALELGRKAILIELNPKYAELAKTRCHVTTGLPLSV